MYSRPALALALFALTAAGCVAPTRTFVDHNSDDDLADRFEWLSSDREESTARDAAGRQINGGNSRVYEHWELSSIADAEIAITNVTWESLGPINVAGRIISHAFHPTDEGTMLVGSASGGLWRTTDHGRSWTPLTDRLMSLAVSAVAYNPQNPRSIAIGTGEGYGQPDAVHGAGVFHSWDAGETWASSFVWDWRHHGERVDGFGLVWDQTDTSRVYFASSDGVYVREPSTGPPAGGRSSWYLSLAGRTTSLIALADSVGTLLAAVEYTLIPGDSTEVWPAVRRNHITGEEIREPQVGAQVDSLWLSTFSEAGWRFLYEDVVEDSVVVGLFRSTDKGNSWRHVPSFVEAATSRGDHVTSVGFTSLSAHDASIVYASVSQTLEGGNGLMALMRSDDGGLSWRRLTSTVGNRPANLLCGDPFTPDQCQGRFDNVVGVSPTDPDVVFVGGVDLYRSVDGGSNWGIVSKNPPHSPGSSNAIHPDNHDFGFDPANPNVVYALTDGGLFRSDRMGEPGSWQPRNTGLATLQVTSIGGTPADPDWISVGAQDNGTHLRTDRSNVWRPLVNFGGDGAVTLIDPSDKDIVYGERQNGFLQRTLDGGRVGRCILQRCSADPMNEGRMRNSGITGRGIWHTPLVMDPQEPQRIYTSTLAMMWVTNNAADPSGVKWDPIGPPVARIQHIAVDRIDNNLIYAYSGPSSLFIRSEDGGATWDTLSFPGKSVSDLQADPDERGVLYATRAGPCRCNWETPRGTTHRVMISRDAGDSWTALDRETPTNLPLKAHTIVILPTSTRGYKRMLVGTDLGVLASSTRENGSDLAAGSSPSGRSWRDVRGNLPYVIVRDLEYNRTDNTVRAGTYGRGVWRASAEDVFRPLETEGDVEDEG